MKASQSTAQAGLTSVGRLVDHSIKTEIYKKQSAIGFVPTLLQRKSVLLLLIVICGYSATNTASAQAIFSNSITGTNPNTSNPYTAGQTTDANITVSGIGRGTGIVGSNAGDRYNASGWNSASFDPNDYFEWTLTPNSGYKINFVSLVYTGQASGSGPTGFVFRASVDGFTANIGTPTATGTTISLAGSPYQNITGSITLHLYGFGASASGGTFSVNDFTFNGTVESTCTNPTAYNVTGGGSYCSGGAGVAIGLENSEIDRNYQLFRAGGTVAVGSPVPGTGSAISFGDQTVADTYTVVATNTADNCTAIMAGNAIVTITSPVTPSVTVSANPGTTTCAGNQVIFTVAPVNGGGSPTYVWKTNSVQDTSVPASSATYTNSSLANGETIDCQMTSSLTCVTTSTADAPQLTITITTSVTPLVSVSANPGTTICAGSQVIFTATPVNGGGSPNYVWKTNGVQDTSVPASSATYTNSSLANAETVDCQLISNDFCASPATADAAQVVMTVNPVVTPSVTILASPGSSICSNSPVTFTATPVNGGAAPAYQWRTNGISVTGATSSTLLTSTLQNGDVVTVVMTASADVCASPLSATSSDITMTVNPIPGSVITAAASVVQNSTGNTASVPDAGGGASYVWTISNGAITAGDGTAAITYTAGNALGTLTLGCTVTTSAGCSSVGSTNVGLQAPVLAGWDVSTQPGGLGNFGTSPLPASSSDSNLTVGDLTRGSGVATPSGATGAARGWGGTDWQSVSAAEAVTANKFATFALAGKPGFKVSYNAISRFSYRRSGSGPDFGTIQYQVGSGDSFHDITTVSYTATSTSGGSLNPIDLSGISALQDVPPGTVVTFRIVNFGGSNVNGTWYVFDTAINTNADLEVSGYVCVPPTATLAGDATICAGSSANLTTSLSGVPPWSVTWSDGVTSNNVTSSPLIRVVTPASTAVYTLTSVTDSSSCAAGTVSGSATVTVNPLPTVTVEPAVTNAGCGSTIILTANPAGAGPLTYQWYDTQTNAIAGETNVTLALTNVHGANAGNYTIAVTGPFCSASAVASVTVADSAAPVITLLGANPATNECHAAYTDAGATASDACAGAVTVFTNSTVDANLPGVYSVTYTAHDGAGNTNAATRTVYVVDTAAPLITYYFTNLTLSADGSCQVLMPDVTGTNYILAEDVCGAVTIAQTPTNNALLNLGTNEVVLAVADSAGHTVYSTNTIIVVDTVGPMIVILGANPATNECHVAYADAGATANDACVGNVVLSTNGTVDANVPGVYVLTYASDDGNDNTNVATRTVYVVDTVGPVLVCGTNKVVECGSLWSFDEPAAGDGCAGTSVTLVVLGTATNGNVFTRTWAVSDPTGNTNTCSQSVTVAGTAAPVITLLGANPATNECHAAYTDAGATASDACAGAVNVSTNSAVDANLPGVYSVTYVADDGDGHTNTATRTVYVVDTTAPLITYYFTNLTLSASSSCQALMPDVTGTNYILAEDTCGVITITQTPTNQALLNLGTNEVVLAVADSAGHTVYSTNTIVVVDTTPPVITFCPTNRSLTVDNTCVVALPDFTGELEANDACSGVSLSQSPTGGTELSPGQYVITFTARDGASNASSCGLQLTVLSPPGANTNISISEFLAKNTVGITDDFGAFSDWIEIRNTGSCAVNLAGWSLTDAATALAKWQFPSTNIGPGQFLVVWASDQNRRIPGAPLHTNFKLSDEGEYLGLVQPDGVTIATQFAPAFPPQLTDVAYGLPSDGPTNTFLAWPTPGLPNSPATNFLGGGTNIIISEFMAKNTSTLVDEDGTYSDWIEVHNAGSSTVNLNGWALTDNPSQLTKWRFPATNIASGQFIVVWASDKNRRTPGAPLHTNFKMGDEGEYLALVQPDGVTIATQFSPTFPPQLPNVSYGLPLGGVTNSYLAWSTPGSTNSTGTNFVVASLEVNPGRGWFTNPVSVTISSTMPDVTIYFTTNGTVPGPTNGFVYGSPLVFSNTAVLRAAAYRPAYVPSVVTHTYVFPTQVAGQTGAGFPTNWGYTALGAVPAYYACNSNLVNDPRWGNQMPAALLSVPTLSVVMNPDDMFGTNGIYANTFGDGVEWERPCSVEYFRPDSKPGFQINCGIRIHGQLSRNPEYTPKHSLRLLFKQMYGAGKLSYDLYPGSPVQDFDVLVLHASLSDHWHGVGAVAQMLRDQWCDDTQQETGGYGTHGVFVNLYIDGIYWGLFNVGERADAAYAARYLGGKESDYDALHGDEVQGGDTNAWNELITLAQAGITNEVAWSNVCYYLNVPHFIDYVLMNFYAVNTEWLSHNWWINGSVTNGVPFHFITWDAEDGIGGSRPAVPIDYDVIGLAEDAPTWPGVLYSSLSQYPEFRRLFGDHAQRLLFNRGALTPERSSARWMKRAREIDTAIIGESVRWGITNWWATSVWGSDWKLYTRDDWLAEQSYLLTNWFPQRTDMLIGQLRDAGLYPAMEAPVFNPHGGIIVESLAVMVTAPSGTTLYYTTNGADPRLPDGSISPDALIHDEGGPLTVMLTDTTRLSARAFATNTWSALTEADYSRQSEVQLQIEKIARRIDGSVELDFLAWPGAGYTLRASTNLGSSGSWEAIASIIPFPDGTFTFVDTSATNYPVRFYRLTWP